MASPLRNRKQHRFPGLAPVVVVLAYVGKLLSTQLACRPSGQARALAGRWEESPGQASSTDQIDRTGTPSASDLIVSEDAIADEKQRTKGDAVHVRPGESIQAALDEVADDPALNRVVVEAGTYRPSSPRQSLVWFNAKHDGITLQANGKVVLTGANPQVANRSAKSYPAIVNHVVYFGDGISNRTILRGFTITGANGFVTTKLGPTIEPDSSEPRLKKAAFFYTDGGGIKIFGRSYPTIENNQIVDNYCSPCGAGISIEHRGYQEQSVIIRNCVFRNNRVPLTGAALDLLDHEYGSSAIVENCLFVANLANCKKDKMSRKLGTWKPDEGHGAVTVFAFSRLSMRRCTLVGNRNGIDDLSPNSSYSRCIFWKNDSEGGWPTKRRYELDLKDTRAVKECFIGGYVSPKMAANLDPTSNVLDAPDPRFDDHFSPRNRLYKDVGYRAPMPPADGSEKPSNENDMGDSRALGDSLRVSVRGSDFNWYFTYHTSEDMQTGRTVSSKRNLHVPVNVPVELSIESDDYLYSLALPRFNVKEIAVPDLTHKLKFTAKDPGVSPLVGDQFCGYTHPNLIGRVIAVEENEFLTWLSAQSHRE